MSKKNMGSSIDDFLKAEGIFEEAQTEAIKEVVAGQLAEAMKQQKISKNKRSTLLKTSHRRSESIQECRDCPGQSDCAGGCMGRAWGSRGDLLAADDRCELRRSIYKRKKRIVKSEE